MKPVKLYSSILTLLYLFLIFSCASRLRVDELKWMGKYNEINRSMSPSAVIRLLGNPHKSWATNDGKTNTLHIQYGDEQPKLLGPKKERTVHWDQFYLTVRFDNDKMLYALLNTVEDSYTDQEYIVEMQIKNSAKDVEKYYKSGSKDLRLELYNLYKSGSITMEEYVSQLQEIKK